MGAFSGVRTSVYCARTESGISLGDSAQPHGGRKVARFTGRRHAHWHRHSAQRTCRESWLLTLEGNVDCVGDLARLRGGQVALVVHLD